MIDKKNNREFSEIGIAEKPTFGLSDDHSAFRQILNDPIKISANTNCIDCRIEINKGHHAMPIQGFDGKYIGFICLDCHPKHDTDKFDLEEYIC